MIDAAFNSQEKAPMGTSYKILHASKIGVIINMSECVPKKGLAQPSGIRFVSVHYPLNQDENFG